MDQQNCPKGNIQLPGSEAFNTDQDMGRFTVDWGQVHKINRKRNSILPPEMIGIFMKYL